MAYGCPMKSLRLQAHMRQTIGHWSFIPQPYNSQLSTINCQLSTEKIPLLNPQNPSLQVFSVSELFFFVSLRPNIKRENYAHNSNITISSKL